MNEKGLPWAHARKLQKGDTWRLRRDDALETGVVGTPEEDCRRQPAGRSRREAASQSGAAKTRKRPSRVGRLERA